MMFFRRHEPDPFCTLPAVIRAEAECRGWTPTGEKFMECGLTFYRMRDKRDRTCALAFDPQRGYVVKKPGNVWIQPLDVARKLL